MSTKKQKDYLTPIKANLSKLQLDKPYKFTELCDTLGIERTRSEKSKIAILKALDTVVEYEKIGTRYHIIAHRTQAKELVRNGRGNSSLSVDMQTALMGFILANKDNDTICSYDEKHNTYTMHIPTNALIENLNMFNYENYKNARYNTGIYAHSIGVGYDIVSENIDTIYQNNHKKFKTELGKLAKRNLIYYTENTLIRKRYIDIDTFNGEIILDENDQAITLIDEDEDFRVATPQEEMSIISIKRNFLTRHNYKHEGELIHSPHREKHYKELNSIIKSKLNIVAQRKVHTIMFKENDIIGYLDKFATGQELDFYRSHLGDSFVDNSLKNAINRHKKAIEKSNSDNTLIDSNSDNYNEVIALRTKQDYVEGSTTMHNSIKPSARPVILKSKKDNIIEILDSLI